MHFPQPGRVRHYTGRNIWSVRRYRYLIAFGFLLCALVIEGIDVIEDEGGSVSHSREDSKLDEVLEVDVIQTLLGRVCQCVCFHVKGHPGATGRDLDEVVWVVRLLFVHVIAPIECDTVPHHVPFLCHGVTIATGFVVAGCHDFDKVIYLHLQALT